MKKIKTHAECLHSRIHALALVQIARAAAATETDLTENLTMTDQEETEFEVLNVMAHRIASNVVYDYEDKLEDAIHKLSAAYSISYQRGGGAQVTIDANTLQVIGQMSPASLFGPAGKDLAMSANPHDAAAPAPDANTDADMDQAALN